MLREHEEALFARWRLALPNLITDGVVDEPTYLASARRILFVLKEVNSPERGKPWDLREFLCGGGRTATWDMVTHWVEGIRALTADLSWQQVYQPQRTAEQRVQRRSQALRSIAVINLKKSPGLHTADARRLWTDAQRDRAFIKQQLQLYQAVAVVGLEIW